MNPTLKAIHAVKSSLNSAERNLYSPVLRRDLLASQLLRVSEEYSNLQDLYTSLQAQVLGIAP